MKDKNIPLCNGTDNECLQVILVDQDGGRWYRMPMKYYGRDTITLSRAGKDFLRSKGFNVDRIETVSIDAKTACDQEYCHIDYEMVPARDKILESAIQR